MESTNIGAGTGKLRTTKPWRAERRSSDPWPRETLYTISKSEKNKHDKYAEADMITWVNAQPSK